MSNFGGFYNNKLSFSSLILLTIGGILISVGIQKYNNVKNYQSWISIDNGKLINSEIKETYARKKKSSGSGYTYQIKYTPYIKYSYVFDSDYYENDKYSNSTITYGSKDSVNKIMNNYYLNKDNLKIYINPSDPTNSFLVLEKTEPFVFFLIGAIIIFAALYMFINKISLF